ncbi:hypothetical protein CUMW_248870 [Citrus unshiu]|nr:hypothetical protein CUMW_248870 [Citrus unshiu]
MIGGARWTGGAQAFAKSDKLVNMLKKQKESNRPYSAICASPALVLEPHNLVKLCIYIELLNRYLLGGLGGAQAFAKSDKLVNMLKKQKESNRPYSAICASPALVLEPHGLLKGKKATAFPVMCNKLSDQSEIENRVVVDGNLITSRGPGTSTEFALAIVEKFFGRNKALELAKIMLFTRT